MKQEPIAWESTSTAYKQYVTQATYEKFSQNIKKFYAPYHCVNCQIGLEQVDELQSENKTIKQQRDELLKTLEHIAEYWNRDQNESAMYEALWHIIDTANEAITKPECEE